jgi:hypothetical protein
VSTVEKITRTESVVPCPWQGRGFRMAVVTLWAGRPVRTDYGLWRATRAEAEADRYWTL